MGKDSYFYKSYTDERLKLSIAAQKLLPDYTGHITLDMSSIAIKEFYILHPAQQQMIELESISSSFDAYCRDIPYKSQNWQIVDETKDIGDFFFKKQQLCSKVEIILLGLPLKSHFRMDLGNCMVC